MDLKLRQALRDRHGFDHVYMVELHHPLGTRWFNTGFRNIDWNAGDGEKVWKGVGLIAKLTLPTDTPAIKVSRFEVGLKGVRGEFSYLLSEGVRRNRIRIWIAFLRENGRVSGAELIEDGLQDIAVLKRNEDRSVDLSVECLGKFEFLALQTINRWTPEHQRIFLQKRGVDPDSDTGFDEIAGIADANPTWLWAA